VLGSELQSVQRRAARQWLAQIRFATAMLASGVVLRECGSEQPVGHEGVVVVEILVAERQAEDALLEQVQGGMLNQVGTPVVGHSR